MEKQGIAEIEDLNLDDEEDFDLKKVEESKEEEDEAID